MIMHGNCKSFVSSLLIILTITVGHSFCQSNYNLGMKTQKAGLHKEATDYFIAHLKEKPDHIKSKIGLKQSGQLYLNGLINKFQQQSASGSDKDAVDAYLTCDLFFRSVNKVGVELEFDNRYKNEYKVHLDNFSETKYTQAFDDYKNKRYSDAETIFNEIYALNPDYKDVHNLLIDSKVIPLYDVAYGQYTSGSYKEAYLSFKRLNQLRTGYKDVSTLMEESLIQARLNLAFFPLNSNSVSNVVLDEVNGSLLSKIMNRKTELLQVLDKSKVERVISEQNFVLRNSDDAVKIGGMLGAKILLTGKIIEYSFEGGQAREIPKNGYVLRTEQTGTDANGKAIFTQRRVNIVFYEVMGRSLGTIKIEYQLISTENGQVLFSDIITKSVTDDVHYFKADQQLMYVNSDSEDMQRYKKLNNNKQKLSGEREVRTAVIDTACDDISRNVVSKCSSF